MSPDYPGATSKEDIKYISKQLIKRRKQKCLQSLQIKSYGSSEEGER